MTQQKQTTPETDSDPREVRTVPVAELTLSPLNPRQNVSEAEVDAMADSIRAAGVIQNLAGWETKSGIEIVAGGRRLRALQKIAAETEVAPVRVILAKDKAEAQQWASVENVQRLDLHPADEVRAYAAMAAQGASGEDIAKAFGVTFRHVAGRMKLAKLPNDILDALRADDITLDVAAAYTISNDPDRILAVYEALKDSWGGQNCHTIHAKLMSGSTEGDSQLAKFVGRARYEAAGGTITEDLFGEDVYFANAELLVELAEQELEKAGAAVKAEGWSWVETDFNGIDWQQAQKYGRAYPQQAAPSEDDAARYDELAEKIESGTASEDEKIAFDDLQERLDEEFYTQDQMDHAGAIVSLTYHGEVTIQRGMVRPKDVKAAAETGICAKPHTSASKPAPKGPYSAALEADLMTVRTCAVQTALLGKPELVLDLLTFALSQPLYSGASPIGLSTTDAVNSTDKDDGLQVHARIAAKPYDSPLNSKQAREAFAAFRQKPKKARNALLTENVAKLISVGMNGKQANPFAELIATLSGADIRSVWTPTASFLSRLKKTQLEDIMAHITGKPVTPAFAKSTNKEKVKALDAMFNAAKGQDGLTKVQKERLATWLPEGLAIKAEKTPAAKAKAAKPGTAKKAA